MFQNYHHNSRNRTNVCFWFQNLKVILVGSVAQAISVCQVVTKLPEWMGSCHPANAEMGIRLIVKENN